MIITHKKDFVQNISTSSGSTQAIIGSYSSTNDDNNDDDDDEPYDPGAVLPYDDECDDMVSKERVPDEDEVASPPPPNYVSDEKVTISQVLSEVKNQRLNVNTFEANKPSNDKVYDTGGDNFINERNYSNQDDVWNRNQPAEYERGPYNDSSVHPDIPDRGQQYNPEDYNRPFDNNNRYPPDPYGIPDNQFRPPQPQWREPFVPYQYQDYAPHHAPHHSEYRGGRMRRNFDHRPPFPGMDDRGRRSRPVPTHHWRNRGGRDRRY